MFIEFENTFILFKPQNTVFWSLVCIDHYNFQLPSRKRLHCFTGVQSSQGLASSFPFEASPIYTGLLFFYHPAILNTFHLMVVGFTLYQYSLHTVLGLLGLTLQAQFPPLPSSMSLHLQSNQYFLGILKHRTFQEAFLYCSLCPGGK